MGLVRFNNQTLSIPEVPDGLILIQESEISTLRSQANEYLTLKSRIPVGVDPTQLGVLVEKGQRFDTLTGEAQKKAERVAELEKNLAQFSNLPKDFNADKWNSFVQQEQAGIRQKKIDTLTAKVAAEVKEKFKVDVKIDPRFIDQAKFQAFDPDAKDAYQQWFDILDEAHTAQTEFVQKAAGGLTPTGETAGGEGRPTGPNLNLGDSPLPKGEGIGADGGVRIKPIG